MKKFIYKSFLLMMALLLMRSLKTEAQICPVEVYNNATTIGVVSVGLYNTIQNGVYDITMISSQMPFTCWLPPGAAQVTVTKSQDVLGVLSGTPGSGGWGIYFNVSVPLGNNGCTTPLPLDIDPPNEWKAIQEGSLSLQLTPVPGLGGNVALTVNYTDYNLDECVPIIIPVVWGNFTATQLTSPNRVKLDWQTHTEQNVDHFSVYKSSDGITFSKVAQTPSTAPGGNSSTPINYTWTDNNMLANAQYYIMSVDLDCRRLYTPIRSVLCNTGQTCPATFTPPNLTPDCPPPDIPHISGPASICDNSPQLYRLDFVTGEANVTWSISPSGLANLVGVSRSVGVVPTGTSGVGTLTATVVKNGVTSTYNYSITFGVPGIYGSCMSSNPLPGGAVNFTATVFMLPGTSAGQYQWYSNGSNLGSGSSYTWYSLPQGQNKTFEVRYNGPCGQSVWYGSIFWAGSSVGCNMGDKGVRQAEAMLPPKIPSPRYKLMQNPTRNDISIQRTPPDDETHVAGKAITIKVFDAQGALRKTASMNASSTKISINTADLSAGLYFVHIMEEGNETVALKVLFEK